MTVLSLAQEQRFSRAPEDHFESFLALQTAAAVQRRRCATIEAPDTSLARLDDGRHVRFGDRVLRHSHCALSECAATAKVPMTEVPCRVPFHRAGPDARAPPPRLVRAEGPCAR